MQTINEKKFIDVFKGSLKISTRSLSIKTLLSDRNLRRINYKPYYQRNYVWDLEKQSFFIESVLLGTEIPPLILFKTISETEVIDGRQRFETLRRFKENDITLSNKGLMSLQALSKKSFNKLDEDLKNIFWNSNIRVFEFEIITDVSPLIEDKIKKEIFRRYNTGITPLTSEEVENAKYNEDELSEKLEEYLRDNRDFYKNIKNCFFPNDNDDSSLLSIMTNYLRRLYILNKFPISKYARSSGRNDIIDILYETSKNQIESINEEFVEFRNQLIKFFVVYDAFKNEEVLSRNKLMYEAIFWAIRILSEERKLHEFNENDLIVLKKHYLDNITIYAEDNSFYYKNILDRFQDTADIFKKLYDFNFDIFIRKSNFTNDLKRLAQSEKQAKDVMEELQSLRIHKPNPLSKPVEEVLSDVITYQYLIRPSYQRQEKVSVLKASSIIESILLGINLPPIFVYKKQNVIKEVIDGQQRLLSIIAFLGKQFRNEENKLEYSKNNNFKLKGLNILTNLNGFNFSSLPINLQDKIQDFDVDEIVIEESLNPEFDPTDLFIRLNQKPYPIKQNSFEMWNSTVDKDVVEKIKWLTKAKSSWFFYKEYSDSDNRTDRMENEELIIILSYINYSFTNKIVEKTLGFFKRIDRVTCRLKNKSGLSDFLNRLEDNVINKELFLQNIEKVEKQIDVLSQLFNNDLNKSTLTDFFNLRKGVTFKKSFQDFYVVWLVINSIDLNSATLIVDLPNIKIKILNLLSTLRNINQSPMDDRYFNNFIDVLNSICNTEFDKI